MEKLLFPIVAEQKESNVWGYKSGHEAVNRSWNLVSQKLIEVLDNILITLRDQQN